MTIFEYLNIPPTRDEDEPWYRFLIRLGFSKGEIEKMTIVQIAGLTEEEASNG